MVPPHSKPFDLIIFDCDGVLVDSERVANKVFARVLDDVCGLKFTLDDMFDTFVGYSRAQCLQKIEAMIGEPPPPELDLRYQHDIDNALKQTVQAIDGIERTSGVVSTNRWSTSDARLSGDVTYNGNWYHSADREVRG